MKIEEAERLFRQYFHTPFKPMIDIHESKFAGEAVLDSVKFEEFLEKKGQLSEEQSIEDAVEEYYGAKAADFIAEIM